MTQNFQPDHENSTQKNPLISVRQLKRRKQTSVLDWLQEPYNHARGEMALWIAVITQAMMDALSGSKDAEMRYFKHEAIHWLTSNSKDFISVCLCAGLDPDYVRRKAKRTLLKPIAWRAEAGKGKRYQERKAYRKRIAKAKPEPNPPAETQDSTVIHCRAWM